jgi:hypothetical protein
MKTDFLEYQADQSFQQENHLATTSGQPLYNFFDPTTMELWNMKGPAGDPWDSWHVGEDYFYQRVTENDKAKWDSPGYASTLKMFCSKTWVNGKGGIAWCPRYFNEGGPNLPVWTPDSSYQYFAACQPVGAVLNIGPVMTTIEGPYRINFGNDLALPAHGAAPDGTQLVAILHYFWGANLSTLEVNYHIKPSGPGMPGGRCQWEKYSLANGIYTLAQTSAFNMVIAVPPPKLNFPCVQLL